MEEEVPPTRDRLRLAAFLGALASAVVVAAFFLPWIVVPTEDRARIREALDPGLAALRETRPDLTHAYEVLLPEVEEKGSLNGVDLYVWSRASRDVNEVLLASRRPEQAGSGPDDLDRAVRTRRAFGTASIVLLALPIASLLLVVHFVAHGFRRAKSPTLILLTIAGVVGGALATSWNVAANAIETEAGGTVVKLFTGDGIRATLVASFTQAACGVFGVTGRNWWRVYVGALATLLALGLAAWAYVWEGVTL